MDDTWRFIRVIERDHRVVVAAVALGPVLRALVSGERPDVPRADSKDVLHRGTLARMLLANPVAIL